MTLDAYNVFRIHTSLKLHFTADYDVFKYGYKTKRVTFDQFCKQGNRNPGYVSTCESWAKFIKDSNIFGKICIANFIYGDKDWFFGNRSDAFHTYEKWQILRDNPEKTLRYDYNVLKKQMEKANVAEWREFTKPTASGRKPPLLQLLMANQIHYESVIALSRMDGDFLCNWSDLYSNDPFLEDLLFTLTKYQPFCTIFSSTIMEGIIENHGS